MSGRTFLPMIVAMLAVTGGLYIIGGTATPSNASPPPQAGIILSTDDCREVDAGDTADVSIYIANTPALFAFEIYFAYDPRLLEVVDSYVGEVRDPPRPPLFLSEGSNSNVQNVSAPVPNSTGLYRLGAADLALGGTAESGDGTLATITLRARGEGVSPAVIYRPANFPFGPRLTTVGGGRLGDTDGDEIFDGIVASGQVAVGSPCDPVAPTLDPRVIGTAVPTLSPSDTDGGSDPSDDGDQDPSTADGSDSPSDSDGDATNSAGASATPTSAPGEDTGSADAGGGSGRIDGAGGGGFASGGDDTFWGIVLIGGGVGLGLAVTLVFARMTRRTA